MSDPRFSRDPQTVLAVVVLVVLWAATTVWRLDHPSINTKDEFLHISAAQEMWHSGRWWLPTVDGEPYFHKPPLKMWLAFPALALLGESTAAYRVPDVLAGLGLALFVFWLARLASGSVLGGFIAASSLIGSSIWTFVHGVRMANLDVYLTLFLTPALLAGARALSRSNPLREDEPMDDRGTRRAAWITGTWIGLATLVKSVAAWAGFGVLAIFGAAGWLVGQLPLPNPRTLLWIFTPALGIPALYYLPHGLWTPGAAEVFLGYEVVSRVRDGYHNSGDPFFYLRLLLGGSAMPPELIGLGVLVAVERWWRTGRVLWGLLLVWGIVPVAAYSLIPSRLPWYVFPALPPLAILVGTGVARMAEIARAHGGWAAVGGPILVGWAFLRIGLSIAGVVRDVAELPERIEMDRVVASLLERRDENSDLRIAVVDLPHVGKHERPYVKMLRPTLLSGRRPQEILDAIESGPVIVLIPEARVPPSLPSQRISGYRVLDRWRGRPRRFWLIAFDNVPPNDFLASPVRSFDIAAPGFDGVAFGLGHQVARQDHLTRVFGGRKAGILLPGDAVLSKLGGTIEIDAAARSSGTRVQVFLNELGLGAIDLTPKIQRSRLAVPPRGWQHGKNLLVLRRERGPGPVFIERVRTGLGGSVPQPEGGAVAP